MIKQIFKAGRKLSLKFALNIPTRGLGILAMMLLLMNQVVIAQSSQTSKARKSLYSEEASSRLSIEFMPFLVKGFGASFEYGFTPQIQMGPFFNIYQMNSEDAKSEGSKEAELRYLITTYGIKGRSFLLDVSTESGPYISGGLVLVNVDTEAKIIGTDADKRNSSEAGAMIGAGYQIAGNSGFVVDLGAHYGLGNRIRSRVESVNGGPSKITEQNIEYGLGLDVTLGYMF